MPEQKKQLNIIKLSASIKATYTSILIFCSLIF